MWPRKPKFLPTEDKSQISPILQQRHSKEVLHDLNLHHIGGSCQQLEKTERCRADPNTLVTRHASSLKFLRMPSLFPVADHQAHMEEKSIDLDAM